MQGRLTQQGFLAKARAVHGNKYDYSQTIFTKSLAKLEINCPTHGIFIQQASSHMQGNGCKQCAWDNLRLNRSHQLSAKGRAVHGDKYDYSLVEYTNQHSRVKIICPEHGIFEQRAFDHRISGCPSCGIKLHLAKMAKRTLSTVEFIAKAEAVHGVGRYDYSQVTYVASSNKVKITCPVHGLFEQKPNGHLMGWGCRSCGNKRATEIRRLGWIRAAKGRECTLYFLRIFGGGEEFYKIGITYFSVADRYNRAKRMPSNYSYEVMALHKSTNASAVFGWEQSILETFAAISYKPKIYFGGSTECFLTCDDILAIFPL
jgi:hypothetical protein